MSAGSPINDPSWVPDPSATHPFPVERDLDPSSVESVGPRPVADRFVFSPVSFVMGLLAGIILTSLLSGSLLALLVALG